MKKIRTFVNSAALCATVLIIIGIKVQNNQAITNQNEVQNQVKITTEQKQSIKVEKNQAFTEREEFLLVQIAMAEAEGESIEGKAMVIRTILNRVESDKFPGTIEEVIRQRDFGVQQFTSLMEGGRFYEVEPSDECYQALELIKAGWDESEGALYFESADNTEETWQWENSTYIKTVGNHNFYK